MTQVATNINSYLSFKLGEEVFASNVSKVLNILEMTKITRVPKAPEYMKGVINLRGTVLPVIDTRLKFDMTATEVTNSTCILVLEISGGKEIVQVGALVDSVQEVLEIDEESIQPAPNVGNDYQINFIEGMYRDGDDFTMILDMELIFTSDELFDLKNMNLSEQEADVG